MGTDKESVAAQATAPTSAELAKRGRAELAPSANDDSGRMFDDGALSDVKSLDDALRLLQESDTPVDDYSDYGSGFTVCEDKRQLIGTPFVIVQWRFSKGDYGTMVNAVIVTEDGRKLILNDGSTGIMQQLLDVTEKRTFKQHATPQAGLLVKRGLTVSDYQYDDGTGTMKPASTFYLSQ